MLTYFIQDICKLARFAPMLGSSDKMKKIDPRAIRTRALLESALDRLLRQGSFDDVTIQHITDEATVNRATFYAHFHDKYHLYDALVEDHSRSLIESRLPSDARLEKATIRVLALAICENLTRFHSACRIAKSQTEPRAHACIKRIVRDILLGWLQAIPAGQDSDPALPPAPLVASLATGTLFAAAWEWSERHATEPAETFIDAAFPLLLQPFGEWIAAAAPSEVG